MLKTNIQVIKDKNMKIIKMDKKIDTRVYGECGNLQKYYFRVLCNIQLMSFFILTEPGSG